jgi:hypothetical protein
MGQNHTRVKSIMAEADILFMPFQVTDLIQSVNPVKLYEYIYSNKASISVGYDETELLKNIFIYILTLKIYVAYR